MKSESSDATAIDDNPREGALVDGTVSLDRDSQLQRGLKSRHIQFLALGGA
jgi:amino acid transporter